MCVIKYVNFFKKAKLFLEVIPLAVSSNWLPLNELFMVTINVGCDYEFCNCDNNIPGKLPLTAYIRTITLPQ